MDATNAMTPAIQLFVAAVLIGGFFAWQARAGIVLFLSCFVNLIDQLVKLLVDRQSPGWDRFHYPNHGVGDSFPSGHAVYFTWACFTIAAILTPRLRPRWRFVVWAVAALQLAVAAVGRVWLGVHWTTDVIGGILLSLAWCAAVLWAIPVVGVTSLREQRRAA
jgi:undecaprenyl-diphosphatase